MLDTEPTDTATDTNTPGDTGSAHSASDAPSAPSAAPPRRRRAAARPAGPPSPATPAAPITPTMAVEVPPAPPAPGSEPAAEAEPAAAEASATRPPARRRAKKAATHTTPVGEEPEAAQAAEEPEPSGRRRRKAAAAPTVLFQAPEVPETEPVADDEAMEAIEGSVAGLRDARTEDAGTEDVLEEDEHESAEDGTEPGSEGEGARRRRRRRGGRGRRRRTDEGAEGSGSDSGSGESETGEPAETSGAKAAAEAGGSGPAGAGEEADESEEAGTGTRRRRRRRRKGSEGGDAGDDEGAVVHVRESRPKAAKSDTSEVTAVRGSTRLEAKKQRRRDGREAGRRRPPILTEAEFLARRESVRRVMVVRQRSELTQIAVLEDDVLVEHYVASAASATMVGNVYLGKVQNVLPSMEAAFVDIGRGRNAVLYAGEVNWDAAGLDGQPKRIEHVLKSGDAVLVQVTKDPIGHKGSRLTANVSLAGRFLVYVPDGSMSGISRKLPDKERARLKSVLKGIVPEDAGVIVRTAAEGATEEQLTHDVERLKSQWEQIEKKSRTAGAPSLLYAEPDLTTRVIRDLFNEDFEKLVVAGDGAWETVEGYVGQVAPDLMDRIERYVGTDDVFAAYRVDEQIAKGIDRKVWLPSGGSLVIDRTEAMTVVDVNTGKFVGKGSGNLEETVTRNNLEAAEEIVRQLRLRDIGGIIVIDFIDMVLESNRELVLRRLTECLGRDRTKHQVAEVTSLGLVQMTRKRIGQGLLEAFSEPCEHCNGRGLKVHLEPVEARSKGRSDQADHDRAERLARVARAAKKGQAEPAEGAPDGEATDGAELVLSPDGAAAKPKRVRPSRAKTAKPAQPEHPLDGAAANGAAQPARRRRATKAAGPPAAAVEAVPVEA